MCPVRRRKMVTWSCRCKEFIASLSSGLGICGKTHLPVVPSAQLFSHSSLVLVLIICLAVSYDASVSGCVYVAPCFSRVSAFMFPFMLLWLGIHCRMTAKVFRKELIFQSMDFTGLILMSGALLPVVLFGSQRRLPTLLVWMDRQ